MSYFLSSEVLLTSNKMNTMQVFLSKVSVIEGLLKFLATIVTDSVNPRGGGHLRSEFSKGERSVFRF